MTIWTLLKVLITSIVMEPRNGKESEADFAIRQSFAELSDVITFHGVVIDSQDSQDQQEGKPAKAAVTQRDSQQKVKQSVAKLLTR